MNFPDINSVMRTADIMRAANHVIRYNIMKYLHIHKERTIHVGELTEKMQLGDDSLTSYHLKILKDAGYVECNKYKNQRLYFLTDRIFSIEAINVLI